MDILVTNDDGVHAPGLFALATALRALGHVQVVAPASNQSAVGHKKTLFQDLPVQETQLRDGTPALAVSGSPSDCIALAALGLTAWPPRLVVSGINKGENMGQDVTYSGTVTAALEATIQGAPALAVSLENRQADDPADYALAAQVAVKVAAMMLTKTLPPLTVLNLNVPVGSSIKGLRLTRQGVRIYRDALVNKGNGIYQIGGDVPDGKTEEEGTDLWAVHHGYASLTPLHLDLTAHRFIADVMAWDLQV